MVAKHKLNTESTDSAFLNMPGEIFILLTIYILYKLNLLGRPVHQLFNAHI